jgi:AcrR family transcriptional regulator
MPERYSVSSETMAQNVLAPPSPAGHGGLRERKRTETRRRIADAAARLATANGIPATTVDDIAAAAQVGRATFFRYFDSKELAIATGLSDAAVFVLSALLIEQPAALGPLDAIRAAYAELGRDFARNRRMFLEQALLSRSSPAMFAWTLHLYVDWEIAIATAVEPRFRGLRANDARPRMLGAMTMAAARLACDEWIAQGGGNDLPALIQRHLAAIQVDP